MGENNRKFKVRQCNYDDLPKVITINETTLPENYPTYFYEQILEKYPESFMVAELIDEPGKLIGYIMWRIERGISSYGINLVKKGHLVSIAVIDGFRRIGVATSLLTESIKRVRNVSHPNEYVLEVRISNHDAIKLYQNHFSFRKSRVIEKYYRDGENAYFMTLRDHDISF